MSDVILKVENLSKQYRLGTVGTGTISHDLNRWWHKIRGKEDPYLKIGETNDRSKKGESDYAWALRDINFEVKRGEVLGIIGKNGAGKSTLLKILSRVTSPTTGEIKTKGRIASLLEVGTGFHPELTGRENIYLNGAILGMTKAEISSKIDEIIEFSGCLRYIDTPVKRYSSGMTVRLAFAVAAHLEPDILVVDEVLAVGDAEFQKKAIGKMQDISKGEGRTVLFVSHDLFAISKLCKRLIVLNSGEIAFEGLVPEGLSFYNDYNNYKYLTNEKGIFSLSNHELNNNSFKIHKVEVYNNDVLSGFITVNSKVVFKIFIEVGRSVNNLELGIHINDNNGITYVGLNNLHLGTKLEVEKGFSTYSIEIDRFPFILNNGVYIDLFLGDNGPNYLCMENAFKMDMNTDVIYNSSRRIDFRLNKFALDKIKVYQNT